MIKAVLFDLDDTLLHNNMDRFLPAYFAGLSEALQDVIPPGRLVEGLRVGTKAMQENRDPATTLRQAFGREFFPSVGQAEADLLGRFEAYYHGPFHTLRQLTAPIPSAQPVVEALIQRDLTTGIATNPFLPRVAVEARLDWAGVPADRYPYALIASYERFHFGKPDAGFLSEFTAWLGLPPEACAMVGNSPQDDLEPARLLGMPTYGVGEAVEEQLAGVPGWVSGLTARSPVSQPTPARILARLRGNAAAFHGLTLELPRTVWSQRPASQSWSPGEILCHLRDVEAEINLPRVEAVLHGSNPFLSAPDSDQWAETRGYAQQPGPEALAAFLHGRNELTGALPPAVDEAWNFSARHALLGPTRLLELMRIVADHDLIHLQQLRACLGL